MLGLLSTVLLTAAFKSTGTMWRRESTAAVPYLAKQVDAPLFDPPVAKLTFRHRHSLLLLCLESSPDCGGPSPVACLPRTRTHYLDLANAKTTVPAACFEAYIISCSHALESADRLLATVVCS
jgi:hypothetical protein